MYLYCARFCDSHRDRVTKLLIKVALEREILAR